LGLLIDPDDKAGSSALLREFLSSADFTDGKVRERCLAFAEREMDMRTTLAQYKEIYRELDGR
jgi:hypothetical protein